MTAAAALSDPGRAGARPGEHRLRHRPDRPDAAGERPMRWAAVEEYVQTVRSLVRGEEASWNGSLVRLAQPPGVRGGPARPTSPCSSPRTDPQGARRRRRVLVTACSPAGCRAPRPGQVSRAGLAAGAADVRHRPRRRRGSGRPAGGGGGRPRRGRRLPRHLRVEWRRRCRQAAWRQAVAGGRGGGRAAKAAPRDPRRPPDRSRPARPGAARPRGAAARPLDHDRNADRRRRPRLRALTSAGITEVAYQPMGPDIPRELAGFARAAGLADTRQEST